MYDELILKLREDAEFLKIPSKYNNIKNEFAERISQAADVIDKLSGERKKGKWQTSYLVEAFGAKPTAWYCSECRQITTFRTFFCPNCGADMRGVYNG